MMYFSRLLHNLNHNTNKLRHSMASCIVHRASCIIIIVHCASCISTVAQDMTRRTHRLREVVVSAKRPMKEIGVQKTTFDSLALKENIALSMADILTYNSSVFVKSYGRATLSTVAFRGT